MSAPNLIEQWQQDVADRINGHPFFTDITIVEERKGTTETALDDALKLLGSTEGKLPGVAVVVPQPMRKPDGGQSNLHWTLSMTIRVWEMPIVNREPGGNGKWHSTVALALEQLLHNWVVGGRTALIVSVAPCNDGEGGIGSDLVLEWKTGVTADAKCRAPGISGSSAAVTLANSESGATVWFTQDGSLPTATNGTAYTTPFPSTAGTLIRAVAVLGGKNDSDCAQLTLLT